MNRHANRGGSGRPPADAPEPVEPHFVVSERHSNLRKVAKNAAVVVATGATFVVATAAGLVVHMGTPPARRLATGAVNQLLDGTFRGKIDVIRLSGLHADGIDGGVITLTAPDGTRVALLEGVHARIALFPLLASLLSGGDTRIRIRELTIDHIDGLLAQTADGSLTIAEAFQPAKEEPPPPPTKPATGLDLSLPRISVRHTWIHGGISALPVIDADLDDLAASFGMTPHRTSGDVRRLRLSTRGMPKNADLAAHLEAHLVLPTDVARMTGSVVFVGSVGGIGVDVRGTADGKKVDGSADVPSVAPSDLARLLGTSPLQQVASAHLEAHGTLPRIDPVLRLTVGAGTIDLNGHLVLPSDGQPDTSAQVAITARNIDARAASATGPVSKLGLDASATARLGGDGKVDGTYDLHLFPGVVGPQPTPDAKLAGSFTATEVRGALHVSEPGVPADVRFDVKPLAKDGPDVVFDASVRANDLSRVPRVGASLRGRATLRAIGRVALGAKQVSARLVTTVDGFSSGAASFDHASVAVSLEGALGAPSGVVSVAGQGLRAAGYEYPFFGAFVSGTPSELHVDTDLHGGKDAAVKATATVSAAGGAGRVSAHDVVVSLSREKDTVTAHVARAESRGDHLDVVGVRVEGAGGPLEGELHARRGSIAAKVTAAKLNVPTILRVAGVKSDLRQASVGLDLDLQATKSETKGHANVTVDGASYGTVVSGLDAKLATSFEGRGAKVHLEAHDGAKDTVTLDAENAQLAAGALDPRAWKRATGRLHGSANVDLHRAHEGTGTALPFEELSGWLTARFDLQRDDAKRRPTVLLDASTRGLAFTTQPRAVPNGDNTVILVGRAFHSEGLDAQLKASVDAETGKSTLDARVRDKPGTLLQATLATTLPMKALLDGGDTSDALLAMPLRAHLETPLRSIGTIPALLGTVPVRGDVGFVLDAEGSAKAPHLQALVHARDITDADDPTPIPISFEVAAIYDGDQARAKIVALRTATQVFDATASVALRASDLLAGTGRWEANADATFSKFPIGSVTGFVDENAMDGELSGKVAVRDLHKAGQLDVDLDLANVAINGAKFGETTAKMSVRDGSLRAEARVSQLDGSADVVLTSGIGWGDAVTPTIDEKAPIDVALRAKNFRIGMFAPFVRSSVSELDGRLNADTKLHVVPGLKDGTMGGTILVDRGLFETPAVGEEFHDLRARIFMKPWGVWNVEEISAAGTSGRFTASARATMAGLRLRSGEAHLRIAEKDKLPLTVQGMELGTVWGQIDATAGVARDEKTIDLDVKVPNLHVGLPDSIGHGVQETTGDATIKVGSIQKDGLVAILPVDGSLPLPEPATPKDAKPSAPPLKLHVTTHLGPDLEVRRGTMLRAYVTEGPTVNVGNETRVSGSLSVPHGYIELQGKRFQIEKGTVSFTGQATDDPVVVATAVYDSPDGTKVYADFVGPVKTGKLTLRSEPQLGQNEILALLLFGTSDGTFGQAAPPGQQGNDGTQAASLAGGVVTEGLNKAISGVSGVEVQTKVDTQESGDPRPEVEVALSRNVSATIIYNLGVPPPGQNPDDTLLVADWRFHRNYSAEATLGDKGTSILDLIWKYRY